MHACIESIMKNLDKHDTYSVYPDEGVADALGISKYFKPLKLGHEIILGDFENDLISQDWCGIPA